MLKGLAVLLGALVAAPVAVAWLITQNVLHPRARVEDHSFEEFGLAPREVSFRSRDGTRLAASFLPAPGSARAPAFVLSHGWARSRAELVPHAATLHRAGYALLMPDYRNRGASDGDAVTLGVREQDDLLGAIDYLSTLPEVDASRIALFGMSTGAVISICVAARDARVKALVCEAPFATQENVLERGVRHYGKFPPSITLPIALRLLEWRIGAPLASGDALTVVDQIAPRPLFILGDDLDAVVGVNQTEAVFAAAGEPKRYWRVPGANHARGWQAAPKEYERRLLSFLTAAFPVHPAEDRAASSA
jgi:dipeptidyl aminopeptidase/acylaminoacyl peptidase